MARLYIDKKKASRLRRLFCYTIKNYFFEKLDLSTPHIGQVQVAGRSSKAVPGAMPLSGSPTSGSYT